MNIAAPEIYHVSVLLKETFLATWILGYAQTNNRFPFVKIVTDAGIEESMNSLPLRGGASKQANCK